MWGYLRFLVVLGATLLSCSGALAVDFSNPAFVQGAKETSIPVGAYDFCREYPAECRPNRNLVVAAELTETSWQLLVDVNSIYNASIAPVSDIDQYGVAERWTYPTTAGDCEDFALVKRRALIDAGWPAEALMIAVVQQYSGEGHAVLMARTDRGDVVLDNLDGDIHLWSETPYNYIKRQSQQDPSRWIAIADDRPVITASH
jgi:predicted transglutaminase-like cysteine proteinase